MRQYQSVIHRRANTNTGVTTAADAAPRLGILGRIWSAGAGLTPEQAAHSNPVASMATQPIAWLTGFLGTFFSGITTLVLTKKGVIPPGMGAPAFFAASGTLIAAGFGPLARLSFLHLHRALRPSEIEEIREAATDDLDRTFLSLVLDAVRQRMSERDAVEIRSTIAALADALDRLPEVPPSSVDTTALFAEAQAREQESLEEADRLTSDSLQRQAEALRRRAAAAERSALSGKRVAALRGELKAQMEALREGLAAMATDTTEASALHLGALSEAVRQVAAEVVSTIDAKAEVAALMTPTVETPNVQRLGRGGE